MAPSSKSHGVVERYLPIAAVVRSYQPAWLTADLVAGLSVWALLVPQGIAYASIAGVPPQYGLYAAIGALVGYALFGSSKQVITGPSASVAAVSASVVGLLAVDGSSEFVTTTATLAVVAGLTYLALGLLRMGWVSNFLSTAVLGGFVFAFGLGLIVDQSHKILGVPKAEGSYAQILWETLKELDQTSGTTLAVGAAGIAALLAMKAFVPKAPRALIVVIAGILISSVFDLNSHGVSIVGEVPTGLPSLKWPDIVWADMGTLFGGALAVIFVGFSESLAAARDKASLHDYEIDASQELVAQGAANTASGLLGGFVVDGSLSKTTVADLAGMRTQVASLATAGLVVLTALFLAGIFEDLPNAILGAVVIDAAIGLVKVKEMRRFMDTSRRDFTAFVAAGLGVFFVGILVGVVVGVIVSLLLLIATASRSPVRKLAFDRASNVWVPATSVADAAQEPGVLVVEISGPLFFADAGGFREHVLELVDEDEPYAVVVDLGATAMIDIDGADILTKLQDELERKGVKLLLAHVGERRLDLLTKAGTIEAIGADRVFVTVREAVAAARS